MSTGPRLDWKHAADLARRASDLLAPTVQELKCVGSIRRKRPSVGDVEFLARPYTDTDLLGGETPSLGYVRAVLLGMGTWVKGAEKSIMIDGCFLKCHGRVLKKLIGEEKVIHIDALPLYKKYTDIFLMDDVPEQERKEVARQVADKIIAKLSKTDQ